MHLAQYFGLVLLNINLDIFFWQPGIFFWQPANQKHDKQVISVVDVAYGGENGFNQAIEQSSEVLGNVKFIQEKKIIQKYFDEISQVRIDPVDFCEMTCVAQLQCFRHKLMQKQTERCKIQVNLLTATSC